MGREKNIFQKQSAVLIALVFSMSTLADSSLDSSINKHQETFETGGHENMGLGRSWLSGI